MNRLIIIGNGFDLAHELKTKYSDFLCYYLKNKFDEYNKKSISEDILLTLCAKDEFSVITPIELPTNIEKAIDILNKVASPYHPIIMLKFYNILNF